MHKCILGIQIGITSGCAIYYNGEIIFAASEERFTKIKNEVLFPHNTIKVTIDFLQQHSCQPPKLIVIPTLNMDYNHYLLRREAAFSIDDYVREQHLYYYERLIKKNNVNYKDVFKDKYDEKLLSENMLTRLYNAEDPPKEWQVIRGELAVQASGVKEVAFVNHEASHAAYALYASGLRKEETLVIAVDGFGDDANCSVWTYENGSLFCHKKYDNFNIGRMYRYITLLLGMKPNEHEYKVMGMAPYAFEHMVDQVYPIFANTWYVDKNNGEIKYNDLPTDLYFYFQNKLEGKRFDVISGALQKYTERMLLDLVEYWALKLSKRKLVVSGGVSLNIKANMLLGEMEIIDEIFVPASGGDESLCIGAIYAYLDQQKQGKAIKPITNMYLGNAYGQNEMDVKIKNFVRQNNIFDFRQQVSNQELAALIAEGNILGRFQGRMEFGARALGNRSILANPSLRDIVKKLNRQIKSRDFWMPFTPSIIDFKADDYLINPKCLKFPFMTMGCKTTSKAQEKIFGALHPADLTARPQIVTKEDNKEYWDLINEFYKITGIGALLNTSLNLHGLPICESPEDVFNLLLKSDLDMAVLGTSLIWRKSAGKN